MAATILQPHAVKRKSANGTEKRGKRGTAQIAKEICVCVCAWWAKHIKLTIFHAINESWDIEMDATNRRYRIIHAIQISWVSNIHVDCHDARFKPKKKLIIIKSKDKWTSQRPTEAGMLRDKNRVRNSLLLHVRVVFAVIVGAGAAGVGIVLSQNSHARRTLLKSRTNIWWKTDKKHTHTLCLLSRINSISMQKINDWFASLSSMVYSWLPNVNFPRRA